MEKQVLEIKVPKDSQETPEAASALFASLSNLKSSFLDKLRGKGKCLSFEIALFKQTIRFYTVVTTDFEPARKYRLNISVANQYIGQLSEDIQKAIFGNTGTLTSFLVGAQDAGLLSREFGKEYEEEDLVKLGNFQIVIKLAIDNLTSTPFYALTLPLPKCRNKNKEKVLRLSRERYTRSAK